MKGKKILFVCPYPENVAPSQRLKFEQYYQYLRKQGYEIETSAFIDEFFWKIVYKKGAYVKKAWHTLRGYVRRTLGLFRLRQYDLVYIHLWVTPFGPAVFERLYCWVAKKIVYDIDDLVYLGNVKNRAHPFVSLIKGTKKPIYLMKHADHVITCTPYLDDFVRRYNVNTTDISSTINTDVYIPKTDYAIRDKFIVGWSGSHSTSKYLHLLDEVLLSLRREMDFKLLVMGDITFSLPGLDVEVLPWKEEHEVPTISRFDVGLYPLPNEEWVLGKSGLKALQYMAAGVPTIATGIGTIFRIIKDGENGFLVDAPENWKARLLELKNSQSLREALGRSAAETVQTLYSVTATQTTYKAILDKVMSGHRR